MKSIFRNFLFANLFILFFVFISGCTKNNSFISNKKLHAKVEGVWQLARLFGEHDFIEEWTFDPGGSLTRINVTTNEIIDLGTWTTSARIMNSKLTITGFKEEKYNGKWFIVNVDGHHLQLNNNYTPCPDDRPHCGTFEREFYR